MQSILDAINEWIVNTLHISYKGFPVRECDFHFAPYVDIIFHAVHIIFFCYSDTRRNINDFHFIPVPFLSPVPALLAAAKCCQHSA